MHVPKFIPRLLVIAFTITSCNKYKCDLPDIRNLGTAQFRISYANHEALSDAELDSIEHSYPQFDVQFNDPKPALRKYLESLGFIENNKLVINKVDTLLSDTLIISSPGEDRISLFTSLDLHSEKTFLDIAGSKCKDSIYLDQSLSKPGIRIVQSKNDPKKLLLVFWKYYFMNGDMFDVALFEIGNK